MDQNNGDQLMLKQEISRGLISGFHTSQDRFTFKMTWLIFWMPRNVSLEHFVRMFDVTGYDSLWFDCNGRMYFINGRQVGEFKDLRDVVSDHG